MCVSRSFLQPCDVETGAILCKGLSFFLCSFSLFFFFLSKWLKKLTVLQCVTISDTDSRQEIKFSLSSEL